MAQRIAITGFFAIILAACSSASGDGDVGGSSSGSGGGTVASGSGGFGGSSGGQSGDDAGTPALGEDAGGGSGGGSSGSGSSGGSSGSGSGSGSSSSGSGGSGSGSSSGSSSSGSGSSGGSSSSGSGSSGSSSGGSSSGGTTPPTRNSSCEPYSKMTGTAINTDHGRLDGTLVYVLPVGGSSSCNGDDSHVHLQIEVNSSLYDVAIDIGSSGDDVGWLQKSMALPGGAWSEGWHGSDSLGYSSLGLSSSAFATLSPTSMASEVETLLATTSKISIFCTGYSPEDNGCHDVHYENGSSEDGAIALDPTSATTPIVFFRFTDQSF